jgi:hypothetical protein
MAGDSGKWVPSWLPLLGVKGVVTMVDGRGGGGVIGGNRWGSMAV